MLAHALLRTTNGLVVKPAPASPALLCSVLPASEPFFFPLRVTQFRLKTGKGQNGGDELVGGLVLFTGGVGVQSCRVLPIGPLYHPLR